jgi:phosphate-selective porin
VNESHTDEEVPLDKDTNFLGQKYSVGVNWYPLMNLNFSGPVLPQDRFLRRRHRTATFPRLLNQDWNTDDVNVRITFRPRSRVGALSLVTRYDFLRTAIDGQWAAPADGILLNETTNRPHHQACY